MIKRSLFLVVLCVFAVTAAANPPTVAVVINEFVANHTGIDTHEFVEIFYPIPNTDLSSMTILEIEGDGSNAGIIDGVFPVGTTDADGIWVTSYMNNMIENGTMTLLVVYDFSGSQGDDLDTDNDGNFDSTPWLAIEDGVAVYDGGGSDHTYANVVLEGGFDGVGFTPGGASRVPNGIFTNSVSDWTRNDFDGEGLPGFTGTPAFGEAFNTPGALNEAVPQPGDPVINEFVANHTGGDAYEFVEISGDPETDYSNFRIVVLEGDASSGFIGRIDATRVVGATNADGIWVSNFSSSFLENGTLSILLVEGFGGSFGQDLDTDDDGTLDLMPWIRVVDDVAVSDGGAGDQVYASTVLADNFDGFSPHPGGASRIPNGTDTDAVADWLRNDFDGDGLPGFTGTPELHEALNTPGDLNDTAIDMTPPVLSVEASPSVLWPPNHKMVDIETIITVSDNRDPSPDVVLKWVISTEPDNDKGDGNTINDVQCVDSLTEDTSFKVRSERRGDGNGREYKACYEATDDAGNSTSTIVCIRVPHDQSETALASTGFNADGTALAPVDGRFTIIIPSRTGIDAYDATEIAPYDVFLGNLEGMIRPEATTEMDVTGDGLKDLAVHFDARAATALMVSRGEDTMRDDGIEVGTKSLSTQVPFGLHYDTRDGLEVLVSDVFALGEPVALKPAVTPIDPKRKPEVAPRIAVAPSVYPNPFSTSATLTMELPASEAVRIQVFDISGRLVRTVEDRTLGAGVHEFQWNGVDDRGNRVSAGVYFVKFETSSYRGARKVVMTR